MSLQILCQKLDKLNDKEKRIRMTYDVRGTNKYQHRFIKDLKEDFRDDLILRYGNKPYGVGWNQENDEEEIVTEQDNPEPDEAPSQGQVVEEDEGVEEEYENTMTSNVARTNFRPLSGKFSMVSPNNRPVSASTVLRPMTASSKGGDTSSAPKFMFGARPISAIPKNMKAINSGINDTSEFTILSNKSPLGMYPQLYQEEQQQHTVDVQSKTVDANQTAKARANESMFWKNTKKYDVSHSTKQFDTKKLLFEVQHTNPNLIATSDLSFLKGEKIHSILQNSKLVAPKDYDFHEVARDKGSSRVELEREEMPNYNEFDEKSQDMFDLDSNSDLKNIFNQSLSYIQLLRVNSPSEARPESAFWSNQDHSRKNKKSQRPVTAHPLLSTAPVSSTTRKVPLEVVHEQPPGYQRLYFSSLSDVRKKLFFSRLNSLELGPRDHTNLNKELKAVEWEAFKDIFNRPDIQNVNLIVVDLNSFDHVRHELEVSESGTVKAKDKEDYKEISQVYKEFLQTTKTNLASLIVYVELPGDKVVEVFSRVLVYEKDENEYDLMVWRNIYRYLLHRMVIGNAELYPGQKTYTELSRIVKDIIEDHKDMVSPIFNPIQRSREHPIIVERNGNVYNFDFHSYITECSVHYANILSTAQQQLQENVPNKRTKLRGRTPVGKSSVRPHSALAPQNKLFSSTMLQNGVSSVLSPVLSSTQPRPNTALFMSPASQLRPTSSHGLENQPPQSLLFTRANETYNGERGNRPTRAEMEKKNTSFHGKEKIDMTLSGDKMEIYQPTKVVINTMKSEPWGQYNNFFPASRGYTTEYPMYNNSRDGFRGMEDLYNHDPNGITLKYKSPMMKKRPNMAIKRPHSAHKTDLKGLSSDGNLSAKRDFVSPKPLAGNGKNARFKF